MFETRGERDAGMWGHGDGGRNPPSPTAVGEGRGEGLFTGDKQLLTLTISHGERELGVSRSERELVQHSALGARRSESRTQNHTQGVGRGAQESTWKPPVVVGISGASGSVLAKQAVLRLGQAGYRTIVTCSSAGMRVWREELDESFDTFIKSCLGRFPLEVIDVEDIGASVASGRQQTQGMLVVPCSMDTLSAIAHGRSTNLLERAADVTLKEGRRLVIVPRENPVSAIHLENMLKLSRLGVRVVLPVPSFYLRPRTVDDVVADVVDRALGALGIQDLLEGS